MLSATPEDWRRVSLTLDRCRSITIEHEDEAALGRIFMQLLAVARGAPLLELAEVDEGPASKPDADPSG